VKPTDELRPGANPPDIEKIVSKIRPVVQGEGKCRTIRMAPADFFVAKRLNPTRIEEGDVMAVLDWSKCPAVESVPGKVSGAWVFRGTRLPVATVFENLEDGLTIEEVMEQFDVTREQIQAVLEFAARSLDAPVRH
jgi:uncharacterized protein (DUF433 family)